jgi:hypothetical protein
MRSRILPTPAPVVDEVEAELVALQHDRRPPRELADEQPQVVADDLGLHVLVEVGALRERGDVQARLVRERRVPDVGRVRIGDEVHRPRRPRAPHG